MRAGIATAEIFSDEGKIVAYRDITAGEIFGELSAVDNAPRSARARHISRPMPRLPPVTIAVLPLKSKRGSLAT